MTVESMQELDALIAAHKHEPEVERPLTRAERRKQAHAAKLAHSKAATKFNNRRTGGR